MLAVVICLVIPVWSTPLVSAEDNSAGAAKFDHSEYAKATSAGQKKAEPAREVFTVTDIGPNLKPVAINGSGQVAATGKCPTCGPHEHALLWSAGTGLKDLGVLPGGALGFSFAYGLNNLGQVVGVSDEAAGCCDAFLWTPRRGCRILARCRVPGLST